MSIAENISQIKQQIGKAELIAVSKTHGEEKIRAALAAGQRIFGENKVQEAATKFPQLRAEFPDLKLHLIGPLQTNKVKDALQLFDVIQTLDREKLALKVAELLSHQVAKQHSNIATKQLFIQVNIGKEPQKAGIAPEETKQFFEFCTSDLKLNVTGLMCIPPVAEPSFMYFALLKNISKQLSNPATQQLKLSMGMSADYKDAAALGANFVRIGSAIFGER